MSWGFILDLYFSNKDSVACDAAVAAAPSSPDPGLSCDPTLAGESFIPVYRERVGRHNATIGIYLTIH